MKVLHDCAFLALLSNKYEVLSKTAEEFGCYHI